MEAIVAEQRIKAAQKRSAPSLGALDLRKGDAALARSEKPKKCEGTCCFDSQDGKAAIVKGSKGEDHPFLQQQ